MRKTVSLILALLLLATMAFGMISTASAATTPINITVIGTQYPHFVQKIQEQWQKVAVQGYFYDANGQMMYNTIYGWVEIEDNEGAWAEAKFRYWKKSSLSVAEKILGDWELVDPDDISLGYKRTVTYVYDAQTLTAKSTALQLSYKQFGNLIVLINGFDVYDSSWDTSGTGYPLDDCYSLIVAETDGDDYFSISAAEFDYYQATAPILSYRMELSGEVSGVTISKNLVYLDSELVADTAAEVDEIQAWMLGGTAPAVPAYFAKDATGTPTDDYTKTGATHLVIVADQIGSVDFGSVISSTWAIDTIKTEQENAVDIIKSMALNYAETGDILTIYSNKLFVRFDTQVSGTTASALNMELVVSGDEDDYETTAGSVEKVVKGNNSFFLLIPYQSQIIAGTDQNGVVVKFTPHGSTATEAGFYRFIAFEGSETVVADTVTLTGKKCSGESESFTLTNSGSNTLAVSYSLKASAMSSIEVMLYGTAAGMTRELYDTTAVYDKEVTAYRPVYQSSSDGYNCYAFPAYTGTRSYNVVTWNGGGFWNTGYVCVNTLTLQQNTTLGGFDIAPAKDLRVQGTDTLIFNNTNSAKVSDYVSFESANPNVLTVDANGTVTGVSTGTTWVYVNVKKAWNGYVYSDSGLTTKAVSYNADSVYHIEVTVNAKAAIYMTNATIVGTAAKIYKLPSLNSDVIGTIAVGTIIDYKSDAEVVNGFLKVVNNNADAYILMSQISFLVQSDNPTGTNTGITMTVTTKGGNLNVRSTAGGTIVGQLANGTAVTVVDTTNTSWYKLSDGNYVSSAYVK